MSDKRLVKESGILSKFIPQFTVLADRGFNVQELLLPYQLNPFIPPSWRRSSFHLKMMHGQNKSLMLEFTLSV